MNTWWYHSKDKQCRPLPGGPYLPKQYVDPTCAGSGTPTTTLSWSDLTDVPTEFPPSEHRHPWSDLDDVPGCFPPCTHSHDWEEISEWGIGALRDPAGCVLRDPVGNVLYPPGAVLPGPCGPSEWPPTPHTHDWSEVTGKPECYPPCGGGGGTTLPPGVEDKQVLQWNGTEWVPATVFFVFVQSVPSAVWLIPHMLGIRPTIQIIDSAGTVVIGDINHTDQNHSVATFGNPFGGTAYCYA